MPGPIFVSRVARLPLLDADGHPLGRVDDVVVVPAGAEPARVLGLVATVQRRRIFVNEARLGSIEASGVRLRSGTIDVQPFSQRGGEKLVLGDIHGTKVGDAFIVDVAMEESARTGFWFVVAVALGGRGPLRRRRTEVVEWGDVAAHFDTGPEYAEVAELRGMHQSDVAERIRALPPAKRRRLAELMEDDRLADLLEELPEDEQIGLLSGLDLERAAHVLEEMEPDDAVDLLGEMSEAERQRLLEAMPPEDSTPLRRLLAYAEDTAGGLMTPEPIVLRGSATVAEALATVRDPDRPMELAAQVFVVQPPTSTPTGRFIGSVPFQRLLREPPATRLEECAHADPEPVPPELPLRDVAERLAAYDALAVPVCDAAHRLVGAVTVDDVLDHVLPPGWRRRRRPHLTGEGG
ncbi:CBS domain-containing protein [Iamia majanohamensis]|uniref:CBS domain-containing protein n=1 Tax=Iamia majanohamensis TaxID=467976 RepID=A0AAE9Y7J3_9ACTN|nr:CBS domain-containing protein [Iamia majanohamensis]WCO67126.1 CBS domain-containing protein [Iamia majanohamensis]